MAHSLRIQSNALVDSYTPGGIIMLGRIRSRILAFKLGQLDNGVAQLSGLTDEDQSAST